jgi:hypothetical protein
MSKFIADHLSDVLVARLAADRALANADRAIVICTVDEHGWPHPAMMSSLELVARDARNIRLALHAASRTARNLMANGRLTVILADESGAFYVKGDVLLVSPTMSASLYLAVFNMRVDSVLSDAAEEYERARMVSGIRVERIAFDRVRSEAVLRELLAGS